MDYDSIPDRAERIFVRIREVYDSYIEELDALAKDDAIREECGVHSVEDEASAVEEHFNDIAELYDDDPVEFCERYGDIDDMEDEDILLDWLIRDFE